MGHDFCSSISGVGRPAHKLAAGGYETRRLPVGRAASSRTAPPLACARFERVPGEMAMTKPTTTTPDAEFAVPFDKEMTKGTPAAPAKGECPAADDPQAQAAQNAGGGGAPGTGAGKPTAAQQTVVPNQEA